MRASDLTALLRECWHRLIGIVHRRRSDGDLAREIAFHIEQAELDLHSRGYGPQEARRLARAISGSPDGAIEALRAQGGVPWVGSFTLDVTLGLRMLRKSWGLSLVGGLAISVVIGICTAVFMYFDVLWSTALPIDGGDRVVALQIWDPTEGRRSETSLEDFDRWRNGLSSLDEVGAFKTVERSLRVDDGGETRVAVAEMSAAGFQVARTAPLIGRALIADDERAGAPSVIVIGYDEWKRRFAGDPNVLGKSLRLDDSFYTIVGVMPAGFGFPINHRLWVPLRADVGGYLPAPPFGSVFARLVPGFEVEDAQAELSAMGVLSDDAREQNAAPPRLLVLQYALNFMDDLEPDEYGRRASNARMVIMLMSLLLVPPGLNIAMLVYARTTTRQEEIAVRTALGASRRRIIAQLFIEMLVLSAVAAIFALAVVRLLARFVEGFLVQQLVNLPFWIDIRMSAGTLLLAGALVVVAALLTGLMPALRATRQFARPGLGNQTNRYRARLGAFWTSLIVAQVGFSFAMLPVATEMAWGVLRAHLLGPGFASEQYVSAQLSLDSDPSGSRAADPAEDALQLARAREDLVRRILRTPGVAAGPTLVSAVPGAGPWVRVELETRAASAGEALHATPRNGVTRTMHVDAAFFETFETRPIIGRVFTADEFSAPSMSIVVSQRFVERTLEGASPLGQRVRYALSASSAGDVPIDEPWYEIVGVVPDVPAHAYRGTIYHPFGGATGATGATSIVLRVAPGTPAFGNRLSELAAATSPRLQVTDIRTLDEIYSAQAFPNYLSGFALVAGTLSVLLLAAAGVYALMSFTVNDQRKEIGIRVALGASKARLLGGVLKRPLRQILVGAAVGVAVALLVERKLPVDSAGGIDIPGVLPVSASFMVLVALLATFGPARRALRLDPNEALRDGI